MELTPNPKARPSAVQSRISGVSYLSFRLSASLDPVAVVSAAVNNRRPLTYAIPDAVILLRCQKKELIAMARASYRQQHGQG
jgi:hypothetical protein